MTASSKERIYIFDSSVFIDLNRINEHTFEIPQAIWDKLDELLTQGKIVSHMYVYEEIVMKKSKKPDKVSAWLSPKKSHFLKENQQQVTYMAEVVQKYPKLIDPNNEKEQADPWLVALARDLNTTDNSREFVLVTQENQNKTTNLPAACRDFNVQVISLKQFFTESGINFDATFS